ncbi:hypothetical protein LSTR_LSTR000872 [Laodelphax striatellus]|uniref:Mutator-like transposase domain-containing protein n=1 Tax=Laodelphax striatellus TaxID=195883 RepID=A0A482X299_LAOST|nr:hypothetical protein LSTR_LSTR000872 [Laodelphax striatellus]
MDVNSAAITGFVSNGEGFVALERLLSTRNIRAMSRKTYEKQEAIISKGWEATAVKEMKKAADEEIRLAKERGGVNREGVPLLTVVADGNWLKRSYKIQRHFETRSNQLRKYQDGDPVEDPDRDGGNRCRGMEQRKKMLKIELHGGSLLVNINSDIDGPMGTVGVVGNVTIGEQEDSGSILGAT